MLLLEQAIPMGGKLRRRREVAEHEKAAAEAGAEAQRTRVLNAVRALYYEALGAQRLVEVRAELARIAREAVGISQELFNVGQADRPDVLESEVEAQRAELELMAARNEQAKAWRTLAAVVGEPALEPGRVEGDLEAELPALDLDAALEALLRDSPELKAAQARIGRQRAAVESVRAERVPDLDVRGGFGYNLEEFEVPGRRVGWEAALEVKVALPLVDRRKGAIAAARAEAERAEAEARRLELALRARLAEAFAEYENARGLVEKYRSDVLPAAERAYRLYLGSFQQMAASYPQVLIAQRTLFQLRADHVGALVELWRSATLIRGLLAAGGLEAPGGMETDGNEGDRES
jgi:cobalt-zinc-cadmium efflux system outer membrane protein